MSVRALHGDSRDVVKGLASDSVDSCVTDPPYGLVSIQKRYGSPTAKASAGVYGRGTAGFMGKRWDNGETAFDPAFWAEIYRVLKPGAHLVAFGGTRTYHRLACAIEDAGFEIRDQLAWTFGAGFPKSHNVGKAIDRMAGAEREVVGVHHGGASNKSGETVFSDDAYSWSRQVAVTSPATAAARQWDGWGTALKPAWESICLARKPLIGTVAANVLQHGTGALNIDGCRVETNGEVIAAGLSDPANRRGVVGAEWQAPSSKERNQAAPVASLERANSLGRWPANLVHDGSDEVMAEFAKYAIHSAGHAREEPGGGEYDGSTGIGFGMGVGLKGFRFGDTGSAARFFFSAKAGPDDRCDSKHPTVKPVALMRWLARLVTPPGGLVLDPFAGSGTTGVACIREGFDAILIEREADYHRDILHRIAKLSGLDAPLFAGMAV